MPYLDETLWIGQLGRLATTLACACALFACLAYLFATRTHDETQRKTWTRVAHALFILQALAIILCFASLYHILHYHLFEYQYAYQHSSREMPFEYILSCFWEGQEGSFLLWAFWNALLGIFFFMRERKFEIYAMPVVCAVQFFIMLMLLGVYIGTWKMGSSPFALLRDSVQSPVFERGDYLMLIQDGRGLNALLQNYWMVIHPPFLFLGFSACLFPFALAVGALYAGDYTMWTKSALRWATLAAALLGLGLMMGAAWAYESLTFGGYWAWDPVENASLIPWLLLVAALHTNLVYVRSERHLRTTIFLYIVTFLSVLYSTYLTRSGVLGETSVHSFTDLGMNTLLLIFILFFCVCTLVLFFIRLRFIPTQASSEQISAREFYMFLGSIVLLLSALIIGLKTSLPVVNKIFSTNFAPPEDILYSFNSNQIFVALLLSFGIGLAVLLRYKKTPTKELRGRVLFFALLSFFVFIIFYFTYPLGYKKYGAVFNVAILATYLCALWALIVNVSFFARALYKRATLRKQGAYISHAGFAMIILAILLSSTGKNVLSFNTSGFSPLKIGGTESPLENLTLIKDSAVVMGDYLVKYRSDSVVKSENKTFFNIDFTNTKSGEQFTLSPDIIANTKGMEGVSPNPDARHYATRDIFAYITFLQDKNASQHSEANDLKNYDLAIGDTAFYATGVIILDTVSTALTEAEKARVADIDTAIVARLRVINARSDTFSVAPILYLKNARAGVIVDSLAPLQLRFAFSKIKAQKRFEINVQDAHAPLDFITLKVYEFPFIMLLWVGVIVMTLGFGVSFYARLRR